VCERECKRQLQISRHAGTETDTLYVCDTGELFSCGGVAWTFLYQDQVRGLCSWAKKNGNCSIEMVTFSYTCFSVYFCMGADYYFLQF
jgi:hypothetical protein